MRLPLVTGGATKKGLCRAPSSPSLDISLQPVWLSLIMAVDALFPIAVDEALVAESGRVAQLALGDAGDEAFELRIVFQRLPRHGIMAVAEAEKAAEAHDGIGHLARDLVDHQMFDLANFFARGAEHFGTLDVAA